MCLVAQHPSHSPAAGSVSLPAQRAGGSPTSGYGRRSAGRYSTRLAKTRSVVELAQELGDRGDAALVGRTKKTGILRWGVGRGLCGPYAGE